MIDITLKQAYDLFLFDRQTFCLDKTIENYQNTIRYFCSYMTEKRGCSIAEIQLSSITTLDLKEYVIWLRNRPSNINHPLKEAGGKLSKRTIRNYTVDLKTFFNFLYKEEYCDNICRSLKIIKSEKKVIIPLSAPEVQAIDSLFNLKCALGCRNYCIIHLMLDAGLRSNEVCVLQVRDVNFDSKYIQVHGKGAKERIVPMARNLRKHLYEYVYIYRKAVRTPYFFANSDGTPITDAVIKSLFQRLRRKAEIPRLKPHLLRHTFATCFILDGGSVEILRILLGHESISTTQIYMHVASVYEFNENPYELDAIFFQTYRSRQRR